MRRLLLALVSLSAVAALAAVVISSPVAAAPPTNEITSYVVTPGRTWIDPETQLVHRYYSVTINFNRGGGLTEARVFEKDSPTATVGMDSDHAVFKGAPGSQSFTGSVVGGLVGQTVYFDLLLLRHQGHTLALLDSLSIGPYSS